MSFENHKNGELACYWHNWLISLKNDKLWKHSISWWVDSIWNHVQKRWGLLRPTVRKKNLIHLHSAAFVTVFVFNFVYMHANFILILKRLNIFFITLTILRIIVSHYILQVSRAMGECRSFEVNSSIKKSATRRIFKIWISLIWWIWKCYQLLKDILWIVTKDP